LARALAICAWASVLAACASAPKSPAIAASGPVPRDFARVVVTRSNDIQNVLMSAEIEITEVMTEERVATLGRGETFSTNIAPGQAAIAVNTGILRRRAGRAGLYPMPLSARRRPHGRRGHCCRQVAANPGIASRASSWQGSRGSGKRSFDGYATRRSPSRLRQSRDRVRSRRSRG
jgi:hypothetical protein